MKEQFFNSCYIRNLVAKHIFRKLRNLIEYATIFEKGRLVGTDNIKKKMTAADEREDLTLAEITKRFEKTIIQDHIRRFGSSLEAKRKIAEKLGISIATLYRKLEE